MSSGAPTSPHFELVDHDGHPVSEQTYRGTYQVVFFGFTHCKMVCPRALARLTAALAELGSAADAFTALYISVDPERDTPQVMRAFLAGAAPAFTGLTGTVEQVEAAKDAFGVFSRRAPDPDDPDGYAMPHTAITYVVDPEGRYVDHLPDSLDATASADRLRAVLTAA